MTIDLTTTRDHVGNEPAIAALRTALFGPDTVQRARVRDAVTAVEDLPVSGLTYNEHAARGPVKLRSAIKELGIPVRALAADPQLRGVFCDETAVSATHVLPLLTGDIDLVTQAILTLGTGTPYQQQCLTDLDAGDAVGVFASTELGGTNGADHRNRAIWDPATNGCWMHTPDLLAAYSMPNLADPDVPNIVVAIARLYVHGQDQGVFAFLIRLRTADGLAEGVDIEPLPDKNFSPMAHAIIRFRNYWVPKDAVLVGDWARFTEDGQFECDIADPRKRFHQTISALGDGRLDLANASVASARAALHGVHNFARQRRPGSGTVMADRDAVQDNLATGLAAVYSASILGRQLRDMRAATTNSDPAMGLWSMLAKTAMTQLAERVLLMCRMRTASHGATVLARLGAWHENIFGAMVAEGETQVLQIKAGKALSGDATPQLPGTPDDLPWPVELLIHRERAIAEGLRRGDLTAAGPVVGPGTAAIAMTVAAGDRAMAVAPIIAASTTTDPLAKHLLITVGESFALGLIYYLHSGWYNTHPVRGWSEHNASIEEALATRQRFLIAHIPDLCAALDVPDLPGSPLSGDNYLAPYEELTGWTPDSFITATTP
ncbi:acyl-CoA dehydrogenase family protein (plasmid) [Nocardia sp. CA-084685]|uniref:acyl-CoA dehydrogenase family protein n=1 Tax=Nocardia sp. CA-084685 TaxID=3239970 RepID=UPI003D988AEE